MKGKGGLFKTGSRPPYAAGLSGWYQKDAIFDKSRLRRGEELAGPPEKDRPGIFSSPYVLLRDAQGFSLSQLNSSSLKSPYLPLLLIYATPEFPVVGGDSFIVYSIPDILISLCLTYFFPFSTKKSLDLKIWGVRKRKYILT